MARKLIKNSSLRSREVAVAIQAIPNVMRDLIRMLNKFSIKIYLTGLPRRHKCLLAMTIPVAMYQSTSQGVTIFNSRNTSSIKL
ncbi:hypothetical protein [Rickettsia endosymbiont of Orchestes rusci]|uniref:hypothetical protein n=1 Tax=Rickettsia endosymbiont of Orchestes rusci TaxID=3066250 RepID=UPI00313C9268